MNLNQKSCGKERMLWFIVGSIILLEATNGRIYVTWAAFLFSKWNRKFYNLNFYWMIQKYTLRLRPSNDGIIYLGVSYLLLDW